MRPSGFTLFNPHLATFASFELCYCLVTDYDGWSYEFRNGQGLTGMQYDGVAKLYFTKGEAVAAYEKIKADIPHTRISGVFEGGKSGLKALVHSFVPEIQPDSVEGYDDAGSW